jgi:hypothetical protein
MRWAQPRLWLMVSATVVASVLLDHFGALGFVQ